MDGILQGQGLTELELPAETRKCYFLKIENGRGKEFSFKEKGSSIH